MIDSITKEVSIVQNNNKTSIKVHTAFLHIVQDDDRLKLYVPKEQRQREVCLSRQLPIELLKHLGVPNLGKGAELGSVITATSSFAVDAILDSDGIIQVPGISPPEDYNERKPTMFDASENTVSSAINSDSDIKTSLKSQYRAGFSAEDHHLRVESIDGSLRTPATSGSYIPRISHEQLHLFKELLDAVIKQARSTRGIPTAGNFLIAPISADASIEIEPAISSTVPGEGLFKIGVAGELFVRAKILLVSFIFANLVKMFEVLKNLGLPLFGLENWRSTIRHRITVHDEYKDMPPWSGSETSDIVYEDHDQRLTELLVANNYFSYAGESNGRPKFARSPTYYIEVKTTPGALNTPFYCSQGQFDRMENMKLQAHQSLNEVYLIARVFKLGASGMGFKLYVDPAELRRKGQLRFTADKYVITT
ncbi:hypothetical protein NHQ30_010548 [Ciborinia camelliae]|nr:hypothetical protein NHQ30_010548 [Ciborinia camelliae]